VASLNGANSEDNHLLSGEKGKPLTSLKTISDFLHFLSNHGCQILELLFAYINKDDRKEVAQRISKNRAKFESFGGVPFKGRGCESLFLSTECCAWGGKFSEKTLPKPGARRPHFRNSEKFGQLFASPLFKRTNLQ
jgi:hypothetical protein